MKMRKIKKYRLFAMLAGVIAIFFSQVQVSDAWDWKKQGFKLDGKFIFPQLSDFGKEGITYEPVYPAEEQDKDTIKVYD